MLGSSSGEAVVWMWNRCGVGGVCVMYDVVLLLMLKVWLVWC